MAEEEEEPEFQFEYSPEHKYQIGEKIYVIDPNGYDIWEAEIVEIGTTSWFVHFPDYPEDDGQYETPDQFLLRTEKNRSIFEKQEKARKENQEEEEEEESTKSDTEDGDFTGGEEDLEERKTSTKSGSPPVQINIQQNVPQNIQQNNYPGLTSFPQYS